MPRVNAADHLVTLRAFYLDLTEWAVEDPGRWGPWVHPCPVSATEIAPQRKARARRKSRMDQRVRERLPVLPTLVAHVRTSSHRSRRSARRGSATSPGELFNSGGETLRRAVTRHGSVGKVWAEEPGTGKRRDLGLEEHRAFWAWAAVEVLRHTGVRIEELAGDQPPQLCRVHPARVAVSLVPLLHIVPSKTDTERLSRRSARSSPTC